MTSDNGLVGLVGVVFCNDLIEDGDDKDCSLAHTGLGLAQDVLALESERDGLYLNLTWMLKSTFSDGAFKLVLEEEFVPTGKVCTLILLGNVLLWLLLIGALILGHDLSHCALL